MSEANLNVVKSMYDGFARGDIGAVLSALDPRVEWCEAENFIYAGGNPYVGPDAVLHGVFARIAGEWSGFAAVPHEIHDAGDTVISLGRYSGIYQATGRRIDAQFVHVFKLRSGKVVKFQQYCDTAQFRDAATQSGQAQEA